MAEGDIRPRDHGLDHADHRLEVVAAAVAVRPRPVVELAVDQEVARRLDRERRAGYRLRRGGRRRGDEREGDGQGRADHGGTGYGS